MATALFRRKRKKSYFFLTKRTRNQFSSGKLTQSFFAQNKTEENLLVTLLTSQTIPQYACVVVTV